MYVEQPPLWPFADHLVDILTAVRQLALQPGPGGSRIVPVDLELPFMGSVSVVGLWPSSQIVAHRDAPITGLRHHIPLQTNPDCWSFHDGVWQQLEVGKGYRMDPTGWHGAVNWGTELRLHLIVDVTK